MPEQFAQLRNPYDTAARDRLLEQGVTHIYWDYAYHDVAIVYAKHPYWIVCMTDQGDENVDFPEEPTQAMQTLGQLVYEYWNP